MLNPVKLSGMSKNGFTLIELSIVLVIIGLIIGGVLMGRDLIKASEVRALYGDKEKIIIAMQAFKLKYKCIAGDCSRAAEFFGTNPAGCPAAPNSPPVSQTCNGSGNDIIDGGPQAEYALVWQHLSSGGFLPGHFRGTGPLLDPASLPQVRNSTSYWYMEHSSTAGYNGAELSRSFGQQHLLMSYAGHYGTPQALSPAEVFMLDSKYDDGSPANGNLQVWSDWNITGCTNPESAPAPNAVYIMTETNKTCNLVCINLGF